VFVSDVGEVIIDVIDCVERTASQQSSWSARHPSVSSRSLRAGRCSPPSTRTSATSRQTWPISRSRCSRFRCASMSCRIPGHRSHLDERTRPPLPWSWRSRSWRVSTWY